MNDTKLADAVKSGLTEACDSLSTVHMAIPASEIMARSDEARRHRRLGVLAGAGGLAAVAVAVGTALPASHPTASHPASGPSARMAAWTVDRQADGIIHVKFFGEFRDPAALQRTLRADGVPASVTFIGQQNPACHILNLGGQPPNPPGDRSKPSNKGPGSGNGTWLLPNGPDDALVINPALMPRGVGLQIAVMRGIPAGPAGPWPYPKGSGHPVAELATVQASPQCTGS